MNCRFDHDECRDTSKHYLAGQNIAYWYHSNEYRDLDKLMKEGFQKWWDEYKLVPKPNIVGLIEHYQFVYVEVSFPLPE